MSTRLVPSSSWAERSRRLGAVAGGVDPTYAVYALGAALVAVSVWLLWPALVFAFVGAVVIALGVLYELGRPVREARREEEARRGTRR